MTGSLSRRMYQWTILLYPEPFQREFGEEMIAVFDQCRAENNIACLLADSLAGAWRQRLHHSATPAPIGMAFCWEVPSSPGLARSLTMAVLVTAIFLRAFSPNAKPKNRPWSTICVEHQIWYLERASPEQTPYKSPQGR